MQSPREFRAERFRRWATGGKNEPKVMGEMDPVQTAVGVVANELSTTRGRRLVEAAIRNQENDARIAAQQQQAREAEARTNAEANADVQRTAAVRDDMVTKAREAAKADEQKRHAEEQARIAAGEARTAAALDDMIQNADAGYLADLIKKAEAEQAKRAKPKS